MSVLDRSNSKELNLRCGGRSPSQGERQWLGTYEIRLKRLSEWNGG